MAISALWRASDLRGDPAPTRREEPRLRRGSTYMVSAMLDVNRHAISNMNQALAGILRMPMPRCLRIGRHFRAIETECW